MLDRYDKPITYSHTSRNRKKWIYALALFLGTLLLVHIYTTQEEWEERLQYAAKWNPAQGPRRKTSTIWNQRAESVRSAFAGAYEHYRRSAFPADELKPLTNQPVNNFNGWGVSIVDSIDTMLLMNLTEQYEQAKTHVANIDFTVSAEGFIPFFEAVIRYLGGLLAAYHLTKEPIFLSKADDIGRILLPVFHTPSGLPGFGVHPKTGQLRKTGWNGGLTLLAEMATCQMEYKALAHLTGRKEYFNTTDNIIAIMQREAKQSGLWTTFWRPEDGTMENDIISVGAQSDSAYEYLLKAYLMTGRTEPRLLEMYMRSIRGIITHMIYLSRTRHLLYVSDINNDGPSGKLEHLSCFLPGLIMLGVHTLPDTVYRDLKEKDQFKYVASGLAHTCWVMYADQLTGTGPDEVKFHGYNDDDYSGGLWIKHYNRWAEHGNGDVSKLPGVGKLAPPLHGDTSRPRDYEITNGAYLLRPETTESMYILWRTTGDTIWREHGWEMFQSIIKHASVPGGGIANVDDVNRPGKTRDEMPSYFLAETLKYFYLLFLEEDPWPLDEIVFNTEAHPLPVFTWTTEEKKWFGVASPY